MSRLSVLFLLLAFFVLPAACLTRAKRLKYLYRLMRPAMLSR